MYESQGVSYLLEEEVDLMQELAPADDTATATGTSTAAAAPATGTGTAATASDGMYVLIKLNTFRLSF